MKLLLDHCIPRRFKQLMASHTVSTAAECGWDRLRNGELLAAAAAADYDAFVTIDKKIRHEHNLSKLPIAILVLMAPTNRFEDLVSFAGPVEAALETLTPKSFVEIARPATADEP